MSEDITSSELFDSDKLKDQLRKPFHPLDIEWRIAQSGVNNKTDKPWAKCFAYVDNRAIMERLDEVFGVLGWQTEVKQLNPVTTANRSGTAIVEGFVTRISVLDPVANQWIHKEDGANNTDFEAIKGGMSGAMKRAAVSFGIGRYLYNLPEGWAFIHDHGVYRAKIGSSWVSWSPPPLPAFALPEDEYIFVNMQNFLVKNWDDVHADVPVHVVGKDYTLGELLGILKKNWGQDYYLTLYAYEALRDALRAE